MGFYTYEDLEVGADNFGQNVYQIIIPAGTPYLNTLGTGLNTSRIDPATAESLRALGIGLILGKDYVGPPEWIIISDDLLGNIELLQP